MARKKPPTKAEREFMNEVASLGCIACSKDGLTRPAEIHHVRIHTGMGLRPSHFNILPLCPAHHRTGKISVHLGKKAFEEKYGTQQQLIKQVKERIKEWNEIVDIF